MTAPPPGLQQERTRLAWRRTTLTYLVVSLLVTRVAISNSHLVTVLISLVVLTFSLWLALGSLRGRRWASPYPAEPGFQLVRDGRLPALVAAVAASLCVVVALIGLTW